MSSVLQHSLSDWSQMAVTFPKDKGNCAHQDERGVVDLILEEPIRSDMQELAAQLSATLADIALAGLVALVHRHTAEEQIAIGYTNCLNGGHTARTDASARGRLILRVDVPDHAAFRQLVKNVAATRSHDANEPLLTSAGGFVGFTFSDGPPCPHGDDDFHLAVADLNTRLNVRITFNGRQYQAQRMCDLLEQYKLLVRSAVRAPDVEISRHSLVTELGRSLIPDPSIALEKPAYPLLTESFFRIADATPDAIAIRHEGRQWTYGELKDAALALAHFLRSRGIAEGSVIALTGRRGFAIVSSILGIFMSGGVLLTVDPKLPQDRQKAMLTQANAKILISVGDCPAVQETGLDIIRVDPANGKVIDNQVDGARVSELPRLSPWAPAYIFFTSGSTGVPKAVLGCHAGLAHFLDWQRRTFSIQRNDCAAQITALSFDMVLRDIFLALTTGASLSIPAEEAVLDPAAILSWMASEGVTILHIVPTLLLAWVNNAPEGVKLAKLRLVFLAGEPVLDVLVERFRARFGTTALLTNFYGPTETTLIKCFHQIHEVEPGPQPAGRPQPQTQILILNRGRQLCGLNEPGEISIRTPYRTLGYLNSPEATARAFIRNPFGSDPDDLIYLTGDKGRYRTDGLVEVQGRFDDQVKIRGVRVEPGEIESALAKHASVKQAAVVAHADDSGAKYLVGYVVLRHHEVPRAQTDVLQQIRGFLRARLPENMVPNELVALEQMPLLPNGKVNRKALVPPKRNGSESTPGTLAELGAGAKQQEAALLAIWRKVLGHDRVSVDDSFVELGGDSLSAISVLVGMQRLGIPDTVARGIFQGWSIRQIVARANGDQSTADVPVSMYKVRINQLVNVTRGILVAIVVISHWFEGFFNVLPSSMRMSYDLLLPVFSVATPGFAMIFGLAMGYIFYPRFATEPQGVRRSMRLGFVLVASGIVISAAAGLALEFLEGHAVDSTVFFNQFYSALLYYALALLTVTLWFRIIGRGAKPYLRITAMAVLAYALHRLAHWLLFDREQQGFIQLCRLMLEAKFNYFNMSIGALAGIAGGIYLARWAAGGRSIRELSPRTMVLGLVLTAIGTALTFLNFGDMQGILDAKEIPLCRWAFYAGTILVLMSLLALTLSTYDRLPGTARRSLNFLAVLGQLSLPIFVLHRLVIQVKHLLVLCSVPTWLALAIPVVLFFGFCWWSMSRLYRLYYAKV